MAWTNITNAQLAIGAPLRSIDILALRDNITAQANGDAGAPKQQTAGIADNAVTAQKVKYGAGLTSSGDTLITAPDSFNAVGSYAFVGYLPDGSASMSPNGNYAGGSGYLQMRSGSIVTDPAGTQYNLVVNLSGTWKWMSAEGSNAYVSYGIACRIA